MCLITAGYDAEKLWEAEHLLQIIGSYINTYFPPNDRPVAVAHRRLSEFLFLSVAAIMGLKWVGVHKKIMSRTPVLQSEFSEAQLVGCLLAANQVKRVFREFLQDHCRLQPYSKL